MYTVTITKKHYDERSSFLSTNDCPLARAIKEQIPELELRSGGIGGIGSVNLEDGRRLTFYPNCYNISPEVQTTTEQYWGMDMYKQIRDGKRESFTVTIE